MARHSECHSAVAGTAVNGIGRPDAIGMEVYALAGEEAFDDATTAGEVPGPAGHHEAA